MQDKRFTIPIAAAFVVALISLPIAAQAHDRNDAPGQQPPSVDSNGPSITGSTVVGQTLSADPGNWNGVHVSYGYQWQRCDASGDGCATIDGDVNSTYAPEATDVGSTLRVAVTAFNKNGAVAAVSEASGVVGPVPAPAPTPAPVPTPGTTTTAAPAATPPPPTTTAAPTPSPPSSAPSGSFSGDRYVWCVGDPGWSYNQTMSGASTPGWAYNWPTWNGSISSTGWIRDSEGQNAITPQRIYYDDSAFPNLMRSVSGSYGQLGEPAGASGPCRTAAVRIDTNDPQTPGVSNGSQGSVLRMDDTSEHDPDYGSRPSAHPQPGQTWYYGFAAATNAGYVPHGANSTDPGFGNWNSFGLEWHASIGLLGPIMQEIATVGPSSSGSAGPNGSTSYPCNSNMVKLAQPRLQVALTGGLNNATTNDSSHTCLRFQGPAFQPGTVYKTIYQVKWDAFGQGSFRWWVDSGDGRGYVLYADASGVSTLWHDGSNNVDTKTYPQLLNYRKTDTSVPTSIMYYGGFIRGSTMNDVSIP